MHRVVLAPFPCWCLILYKTGPESITVQGAVQLLGCQRASRSGDYNDLAVDDQVSLGILRENLQEAKDLLPQPVVSWQVGQHAALRQGPCELDSCGRNFAYFTNTGEIGLLEARAKAHASFVSLVLDLSLEEPYGAVRDLRRDSGPLLLMILIPELAKQLGPDTSSFCTSGRYAARLGVEVAPGREQPADLPPDRQDLRNSKFNFPVSVKCYAVQLAIRMKNPEECIVLCLSYLIVVVVVLVVAVVVVSCLVAAVVGLARYNQIGCRVRAQHPRVPQVHR